MEGVGRSGVSQTRRREDDNDGASFYELTH